MSQTCFSFAMTVDSLPLVERRPLDVGEKEHLLRSSFSRWRFGQGQQPGSGFQRGLMFCLPAFPGGLSTVFLHQDAKERVVRHPCARCR